MQARWYQLVLQRQHRFNQSGHAGRRIDAQLAKSTGRQAYPETRTLIDRQGQPGAGELVDLDGTAQPVGGQCFEPIRGARMGGKESRVVA